VSQFEEILEAYDRGFKMIKVTLPLQPYNKKRYYAYWEQAQKLEMPVLFHTGIVTTLERDPNHTINSWYMHPMRVEPIANSFPDLNIIIAHLGVHWNKDAAELVRMKPNVYVDLTGEPRGWRLYADQIGMDHYLWWEGAFKKVIFGTDVFYGKIRRILKRDKERYDTLGLNRKTKDLIFSGNILNMLNLE